MSAAPAAEPKPLGARYTDSQREESLIEKIIRERGGEMPRVKFSEVNIPATILFLHCLCTRIIFRRSAVLDSCLYQAGCLIKADHHIVVL